MTNVCVYGLGYIGLPTAAILADTGLTVLGVDVNEKVVNEVNRGSAPHGEEEGLAALVARVVSSGRLTAATVGCAADAHIISVGTPVGARNEPDLTYVEAVTRAVAEFVRPGDLVVLESTVPPATCERLVGRLIRELTGLDHRTDYGLAHCPERVLPGRLLHEIVNNDRIIGGTTEQATCKTADLYRRFTKGEILETDATTAEMSKLMENTYRDVNIALANVFADVAKSVGIGIEEAISLCNRHPRVRIHTPGIGVGGHCIPVDPWFLVNGDDEATELLRVAREVNDRRPAKIAAAISRIVLEGNYRRVALLGLTYKPDVDDVRESPAVKVASHVARELGQPVLIVEPYIGHLPAELGADLRLTLSTLDAAVKDADLLIRLVPHRDFLRLDARPDLPRLVDVDELIGPAKRSLVHGSPR